MQIQRFGLIRAYKDRDSATGQWLRLIFGLPSLPADQVADFFNDVMLATEPENPAVVKVSDYLTKYYTQEDSKYPQRCGPVWIPVFDHQFVRSVTSPTGTQLFSCPFNLVELCVGHQHRGHEIPIKNKTTFLILNLTLQKIDI